MTGHPLRSEELAPHGTNARYQHEIRTKGQACDDCKAGNSAYNREWRQRTGRTKKVHLYPAELKEQLRAAWQAGYAAAENNRVLTNPPTHLPKELR